ncbi:MAG: sigma factor-like helix-turn-helix DNA-binding protein [Chthonomonadales bacterium]
MFRLLGDERRQRGRAVCADEFRKDAAGSEQEASRTSVVRASLPELLVAACLAEGDRRVLRMYYLEGLTDAQVGAALGVTQWAATKRRYRALRRLRMTARARPF